MSNESIRGVRDRAARGGPRCDLQHKFANDHLTRLFDLEAPERP